MHREKKGEEVSNEGEEEEVGATTPKAVFTRTGQRHVAL